MSLDKSIEHKKSKRKQYRGSKRFDQSCRNHGSCSYCRDSRTFNKLKRQKFAELDLKANEIDIEEQK